MAKIQSPPADLPSWLAVWLAADPSQPVPPAKEREIQAYLKQVGFAEIITAIECARGGPVESRLYQDWIAANPASPHLFAAWFNLGVVLARDGDPTQALTAYCNARSINPAFHHAAINLGLTLEGMGQTDAALQAWDAAIQTNEARTGLFNQRARLMEQKGRLNEAEGALRLSLLTDPAQPDAIQHWMNIRQKMCSWPIFETDIPGLTPEVLLRQSGPLAAMALTDDVGAQCDIGAVLIGRKMPPAPCRLAPPDGYRHDRIRVGYLSSDFCRHAMSYLIAELFEQHDRSLFEVFGYCSTIDDDSDIRRRVLAAFDHHRLIREMSDEQAARLIRDDEIDIIIDLNGLTAHTRLAVLRWRPAPIQATYLGFVGPVPLPELDYLLADDFVVPPEHASKYLPVPLTIARLYQANDAKRAIGPTMSRQEAGLPDDAFVLCCFSNHYKITEEMFAAWMAIMRQAERAVLWLTADDAGSQANMRAAAARAGVAAQRLLFVERTTPELYLSRLRLADLFLDTFPYNAGTVASDAIRMQVPLLTLCGGSFASRMAGSLLNAIGAPQGITGSLDQYVAVGTALATDAGAYGSYKQHFTVQAWQATIGNTAGFAVQYEATLISLIDKQAGRAPAAATKEEPVGVPLGAVRIFGKAAKLTDGCLKENEAARSEPVCTAADVDKAAVALPAAAGAGLGEMITAAEKMATGGKPEVGIGLYAAWLRQHSEDSLRHIAHFNQGALLSQQGQIEPALMAYVEAIGAAPQFLPPYINAGLTLERLGHLNEAIGYWLRVVACTAPVNRDSIGHKTSALKHLSRVYKAMGDVAHAEEALRWCLDIDPKQRDAIQHWIAMREQQCKWPVIAPWGKLTHTDLMAALSPLSMAIHTDDPLYQLANANRCYELDVIHSPAPGTAGRWIPAATPRAPRPLRIGYVSPDLREHAIGFLTAELFELHDRTRVEVFAYFSGPGGPDALQARIRGSVDHWTTIVDWTDRQTAQRIGHDGIDILVDLGGHTSGAPGPAFALRPAPVIVNWLGFPGSMATPHHQYIIADETIIPPAYEKYYSERVLRLPCYQPTDRKRIIAARPSRDDAGLSEGAIVYCCFNGTQKITPVMFRRWMAILDRVPHAVLWLLSCDAATDERLRQQAALQGISGERLVFATRKLNAEHLARYSLADLFLDTSPYGAHTTASDSLWMGVPVLTLRGHSFASRVCASLVRAAGLPELVCDSPDAYVDRAVELGSRPDALRALRDRLWAARDRCTLFDTPLLATRLESLYEQMWDDYLCDRLPEPDLTNLSVFSAIGDKLDHEAVEAADLQIHASIRVAARNDERPDAQSRPISAARYLRP